MNERLRERVVVAGERVVVAGDERRIARDERGVLEACTDPKRATRRSRVMRAIAMVSGERVRARRTRRRRSGGKCAEGCARANEGEREGERAVEAYERSGRTRR